MELTPLERAIEIAGGKARLARKIGVTAPAITYWLEHFGGKPPAHRCVSIEDAVDGQVTRYELRPDVFKEAV